MSLPRYPEYKASGVAWLGEVPGHWEVRKIRWLCEIKKRISGELGYDVLSITQQGIKVKDIESNDGQISMDYSKYQFVEIGDFAMNHMDLLTGYVDISSVFGVTSPDYRVFSIRDKKDCYDRYVLYLFQMGYRNKIFYAFGQGSSQLGRWRLPTEQFNDFFFPLPPIEEQQTISTFLDRETGKIDALIAEQRRLMELLAEKCQAVISHAVTKGLNPNAKMKDSCIEWLGEVPRHWEVKRIKQVSDVRLSNVDKHTVEGQQPVRLCNYVDVYKNDRITSSIDFMLATASDEQIARLSLLAGDVIITKDSEEPSDIGVPALVAATIPNLVCGYHLALIRPTHAAGGYLRYLLKSDYVKAVLEVEATGMTRYALGKYSIENLVFLAPPIAEQQTIAAFLDNETAKFDALTAEANRAIGLLQERRSALISATVTGKIDVRVPQLLEVA
jgi:type I restriction enzyme S subunit